MKDLNLFSPAPGNKPRWRTSLLLAACLALLASNSAMAQYVWLDDKGVKQYTDIPPPPNTPKNRIIKAPGAVRAVEPSEAASASASSASASASSANASSAPLTTAERNAAFIKRKQEQAEKEKKEAADEEQRLAKLRNCEAARANQRNLDSGVRLTQIDKNGERVNLTEEQKAQNKRENAKILEACR